MVYLGETMKENILIKNAVLFKGYLSNKLINNTSIYRRWNSKKDN